MKRVDVYCFGGIMEAIIVGWNELQSSTHQLSSSFITSWAYPIMAANIITSAMLVIACPPLPVLRGSSMSCRRWYSSLSFRNPT